MKFNNYTKKYKALAFSNQNDTEQVRPAVMLIMNNG